MYITINKKQFKWSFKKFFVNMILLSIIIVLGLICISAGAKATVEREYQLITVHSGETLWTIAKEIAPETDPRITIAKIKEANQLDQSKITPGQILKIVVE